MCTIDCGLFLYLQETQGIIMANVCKKKRATDVWVNQEMGNMNESLYMYKQSEQVHKINNEHCLLQHHFGTN